MKEGMLAVDSGRERRLQGFRDDKRKWKRRVSGRRDNGLSASRSRCDRRGKGGEWFRSLLRGS